MISSFFYFLGLIIFSIAIGHECDTITAWKLIGFGTAGYGIFTGMLNYLNNGKEY